MIPTQKLFPLGRTATAAIVGCFLAGGLLANVLHAASAPTNSVVGWPFTPPAGADAFVNGFEKRYR